MSHEKDSMNLRNHVDRCLEGVGYGAPDDLSPVKVYSRSRVADACMYNIYML
jgi:hypothetical protein